MKYIRTSALLLVVCYTLLVAVPATAQQVALSIIVSPQSSDIQTDGTYIIWTAPVSEAYDAPRHLYAAAFGGRNPVTVATNLTSSASPGGNSGTVAISNGVVVWLEGNGTERHLRAKNLATGQVMTVAAGEIAYPAIVGNTVSWWEDYDVYDTETARKPATLKARDIVTMANPVLLTETPKTTYGFGPSKMSDNWVVYTKAMRAAKVSACWDLEVAPINGGTPRTIADIGCLGPRFDIVGDQLSYVNADGLLVSTNLRTGTSQESGPHYGNNLTSNGRYAFWSKHRPTNAGKATTDLWGYDVLTDSAFPLSMGEVAANEIPQIVPHTRGNLVAWLNTHLAGAGQLVAVRISDVLPTARQDFSKEGRRYFPEVGHTLGGSFHLFWELNGGLPVFGYPLTEEFIEKSKDTNQGYTVQYLERQRFEYHPENAGTPYIVLLGRLGAEALAAADRNWATEPKANSARPHYFAATGHAIAPQFWSYWRSHGLELGDHNISERESLALFGYPITEPAMEKNSSGDTVLTQWFERARFEFHPNNPDAFKVLLGRLGADKIDQRGWW